MMKKVVTKRRLDDFSVIKANSSYGTKKDLADLEALSEEQFSPLPLPPAVRHSHRQDLSAGALIRIRIQPAFQKGFLGAEFGNPGAQGHRHFKRGRTQVGHVEVGRGAPDVGG